MMKRRIKDRANDRCIVSECGRYMISRITLGGQDLYEVYHQGQRIGDGRSGNEARRVAERHSKRGEA